MALTFAHPAAAVPLRKVLGRAGVLSALIIGSIVPDLRYFVPLPVSRDSTHSLLGLFWFCLPVGALSYAVFHSVLKQPLCALLPLAWQARLAALVHGPRRLPDAPWWAVGVSIVVGALTHLAWDPFTHGTPSMLATFPLLGVRLFSLGHYRIYVHTALFSASSLLGVALLALWFARWLRGADPLEVTAPLELSRSWRITILVALVAGMAGMALGEVKVPRRFNFGSLHGIAVKSGIPSLSAFGGGVLLYCAGWHGIRAARRRERS